MESGIVILSFTLAWLVAQIAKVGIDLAKNKKTSLKHFLQVFTKSGGMPSGHTASLVAATTMIGIISGFDSALFAFSLCVTGIIAYDAMNVRYAVGEQGKVINRLAGKDSLKIVEGHTLPQVVVGAVIGVLAAVIIALVFGKI